MCHLHSSIYSLGDKYQILTLKAYSLEKFERACKADVQNALLPSVIDQIYEGCTPADKKLRGVLVNLNTLPKLL